jgi:hypothetical protein
MALIIQILECAGFIKETKKKNSSRKGVGAVSGTANHKQNAAQKPYIAADYVWAAICYLDSPKDSRLQGGYQRESPRGDEPVIFLDDLSRDTPWNLFVKFLIGSILLLVLGVSVFVVDYLAAR